ncbi:dipeptidyl peptidase 9 isoform X2 [Ischnura elegans]|nr:dipeptidyl peptidase 9 isoform X2 [Ischnura elegans]XP_046397851.1 dipeptidyl peptidase 9 isoform X2 [Ischnura elegans]
MEEGTCDASTGSEKKEDSPTPPRKSWLELKSVVCELRRQLSSLSSSVPGSLAFRTLNSNCSGARTTRVYFLATPPGFWESTLLYVDISPEGCTPLNPSGRLQWHPLIEGSFHSVSIGNFISSGSGCQSGGGGSSSARGGGAKEGSSDGRTSSGATRWSREEQLQWERRRVATWGIASYELHPQSGLVVFPSAGSLFQCRDLGLTDKPGPLFPTEFDQVIQGVCHEAMLNPEICPWDPDMVAFVSESDIWVTHLPTVSTVRMTHSYRGCGRSLADDPLSSGIPSYVTQEEFSRYQGFWWQPESYDGTYRILYEEVDESLVNICHFPTFSFADSGTNDVEEFRFPRAGTPNAKWTLKMVEFRDGPRTIWELKHSLSELFPWAEYLVRAGWLPGGLEVWVQLVDRRQQRLELVIIPLSCFTRYCPEVPALSPLADQKATSPSCEDRKWGAGGPKLAEAEAAAGGSLAPVPQVVLVQHSSTWINVCDLLYFFEGSGEKLGLTPSFSGKVARTVCFIIGSEESDFRHLYLVKTVLATEARTEVNYGRFHHVRSTFSESNGSKRSLSPTSSGEDEEESEVGTRRPSQGPCEIWIPHCMDQDYKRPEEEHEKEDAKGSLPGKEQGFQVWPLTMGEWEVVGGGTAGCGGGGGGSRGGGGGMGKPPLWVNEARGLVYFIGLRESPLECHLYAVSIHQPGHVRLLSQLGHSHSAEFNKDCSLVAIVFSSIHRPPACQLFRVSHLTESSSVEGIVLTSLGFLLEPSAPVSEELCPDLYAHRISSGDTLHAMVFKPHSFSPGKRYPTVLYVYGGPEVQLVTNNFKGMRSLRMHMLAALGYCVVAIDSRGSQHRGVQFESHLRCRMGTVELADQVEVLQWLISRLGFINPERIAIHGWSYGGYLSLLALVHFSEVFKVAVAGAPVTSWHLYDTGYTERYMDLPSLNPDGYKEGSVLTHAHMFPEEANRLLVIHGLMDENVHFVHTSELIGALVRAGKPYQLQIYPNERHSLRHLDASKHYEMTLLSFLENHL